MRLILPRNRVSEHAGGIQVSSGIFLGMMNIFLPDSKGNGIKPGTVQ